MKMKNRLKVIALIPLFLSLIIILAIFWANHEIRSSREINRTGDKIVGNAFELNLTTDEYLLYPGERPKIQFQTIHNSVEKSLETIQIRTVEERDIIKRMQKNHVSIGSLFNVLVSIHEKPVAKKDFLPAELREMAIGQILAISRESVSNAFQLSRISQDRMDTVQRGVISFILIFALISGMGLAAFTYLMGKRIERTNEDLQREVTERKRMEEELRTSRNELEIRVQERTAELARANELLERMFSGIDTMIAYMDKDSNFIRVNRAYAEADERTPEFYIGKNHFALFPNEENEQIFRKVVETGEPCSVYAKPFEYAEHPERGVTHWDWSLQPVKESNGSVGGVVLSLVNVTDRIRAQEAVEAERQRFNAVLEILPAYLVLLSPDYHVPFANRFFRERFGESHGRRCFDYLFGRSKPCETCESFTALKTMAPHKWEWTGPDGHNYDVFDFPFTDSDGSVLILEMGIDITERKRAEGALRAAHQYNRSLIEASLDPLVTISPEGKVTDVNTATEQVTGFSRKELIGTDFSNYFTEPEKAQLGYRQVFSEGFVKDYPLAIRHTSGHLIDVLYHATVYKNEAGEVQGVFAAARDITELKRTQDALRAASLYTRSLIEASLDPLVTISADGKIMDVNSATELTTGVSRDELIGTDFSNYFTEPEKAREGYQRVFREGFVKDYPLAIRHVSGKVADVLYHGTVYKNEVGEIQGVFAAARDITVRKRMEEELRKSETRLRLLSSQLLSVQEAERKRIAREIHDSIGQTLAAIKFGLESKLSQMGAGSPPPGVSIENIISLTQNGIEESRRIQMDLRPSVLDDLGILATIGWFTREFQKVYSHISVEKQISVEENEIPDSLKTALFRVMQEAMNNIAKHSKADLVHLTLRKTADKIQLSIEDNGPGFNLENIRQGLGLTSMRERTELSGGAFEIESIPGKGTTIKASWPL